MLLKCVVGGVSEAAQGSTIYREFQRCCEEQGTEGCQIDWLDAVELQSDARVRVFSIRAVEGFPVPGTEIGGRAQEKAVGAAECVERLEEVAPGELFLLKSWEGAI